jgi:hypothetical protein
MRVRGRLPKIAEGQRRPSDETKFAHKPQPRAGTCAEFTTFSGQMSDNDPAQLRAKILRYRELLQSVTDPRIQEALRDLIRMTNEKLNGHAQP